MPKIAKIEPDNIKDSVVEIRYDSNVPHELILGIVYSKLKDTFEIVKQASPNSSTFQIPGNAEMFDFKFEKTQDTLIHDGEMTIKFTPGTLVFNCYKEYLTWPKYFKKIRQVLEKIYEAEIFNHVHRIGLRYINEYFGKKLEDIVNFEFKFGVPDVESNKFNFRSEFDFQDYLIILNLVKNVGTSKADSTIKIPVGIVDIDVIKQNQTLENLENVLSHINEAHGIEKTLFFDKLLNEGFKNQLKITYHDA